MTLAGSRSLCCQAKAEKFDALNAKWCSFNRNTTLHLFLYFKAYQAECQQHHDPDGRDSIAGEHRRVCDCPAFDQNVSDGDRWKREWQEEGDVLEIDWHSLEWPEDS